MLKKKLAFFIAGSTLLIVFVFYGYQIVYTPNVLVNQEDRIFIIKSDATFNQVRQNLIQGQLIGDIVSFSFIARLYDYDQFIQPGRYRLRRNMTNIQAVQMLRNGIQEPVNITFTHVRLFSDLGSQITKNIGISSQDFNKAVEAFIRLHKDEFNQENILSLFIPNTYEVYYTISAEQLVKRMYQEYRAFWNKKRKSQAQYIGLTPVKVSILASIVQAETIKLDEAPIVAGLYLNRLRKNILLQADPTLVYALGDFSLKRILNKDKQIDSPYNTYQHKGLPPGPINMPQIATIDAVLNAKDHNYFYMCAKEDFSGYHHFSTNLRQHLFHARIYQRALTLEQRKAKLSSQNK